MRRTLCAATTALLLALPLVAPAQTPASKPAAAAKPAGKPMAKPVPKPAAAAPAAAPSLPQASADQMQAAGMAHLGGYDCEFGQTVRVEHHPRHAGYVDVHHRKAVWTMKPVLSSTGALRLEDVRGRMLMLQVANKSMVMDVKLGQRVLDGCLHEKQKAFVKPADSEGLGIAPAASTPR
jgi:hypothetical protein